MVLPAIARYPEGMTDIFDVIADPTRRLLLSALRDRVDFGAGAASEAELSELVDAADATRPTVVRHLGVLVEFALVSARTDGRQKFYRLTAEPLEAVEEWLVPFVVLSESVPAQAAPGEASPAFAAWSGADVGETIGRAIAERSHQARSVIHDASEKVTTRLPGRGRRGDR